MKDQTADAADICYCLGGSHFFVQLEEGYLNRNNFPAAAASTLQYPMGQYVTTTNQYFIFTDVLTGVVLWSKHRVIITAVDNLDLNLENCNVKY